MNAEHLYHYRVDVVRVVDGDTFLGLIDLGFGQQFRGWPVEAGKGVPIRLLGIDTPEPRGETKERGLAATARTKELIDQQRVYIRSVSFDNFGRVLADVWLMDGRRLADILIAEGHVA